jgi:hypothetical protein
VGSASERASGVLMCEVQVCEVARALEKSPGYTSARVLRFCFNFFSLRSKMKPSVIRFACFSETNKPNYSLIFALHPSLASLVCFPVEKIQISVSLPCEEI